MTTYQTDAMTMKRAAATIRMVMAVKMTRTVPMSRNLCYAMFELDDHELDCPVTVGKVELSADFVNRACHSQSEPN